MKFSVTVIKKNDTTVSIITTAENPGDALTELMELHSLTMADINTIYVTNIGV